MDTIMDTTRRGFLRAIALSGAAAACAPAAAPAANPSAQPAGREQAAWEREWDDLVVAAKKEGKLSILSLVGSGYRKMTEAFEQAFPGIVVDQMSEASASVWVPKIRQERQAGIYSFDAAVVPPNSALSQLKPEGVWAPLKPVLFRPDVLDDKAWRNGFSGRFMDAEGSLALAWEYNVRHAYAVDTNTVKEEIKTVKDLLNPKWKGKMILTDPRIGDAFLSAAALSKSMGTDVVKQLFVDQEPTFSRDPRQITEALVRGRNPIALGVRPEVLKDFRDQGLAKNVKFLDLPEADFVPSISVFHFDRAPHPAAAKLFLNWLLSKEGQTVLTRALPSNSARTDVEPFDSDGVGTPGKVYYESGKEINYPHVMETQKFINSLLGVSN